MFYDCNSASKKDLISEITFQRLFSYGMPEYRKVSDSDIIVEVENYAALFMHLCHDESVRALTYPEHEQYVHYVI